MMISKVLGGMLIVTLLSLGGALYFLKKSTEANGALIAQKAQLEQSIEDWEKSFDKLSDLAISANESLVESEKKEKKAIDIANSWYRKYTEEVKIDEEIRTWDESIVPESFWNGLRQSVQDLDTERTSSGSPSSEVHNAENATSASGGK